MSTTTEQHESDAERREAEALDAYSRVVVDVAERVAPRCAAAAAGRSLPAPAARSR